MHWRSVSDNINYHHQTLSAAIVIIIMGICHVCPNWEMCLIDSINSELHQVLAIDNLSAIHQLPAINQLLGMNSALAGRTGLLLWCAAVVVLVCTLPRVMKPGGRWHTQMPNRLSNSHSKRTTSSEHYVHIARSYDKQADY